MEIVHPLASNVVFIIILNACRYAIYNKCKLNRTPGYHQDIFRPLVLFKMRFEYKKSFFSKIAVFAEWKKIWISVRKVNR